MLSLHGGNAVSPFRAAKVLANLRDRCPHITHAGARFVHFLDVAGNLDSDELERTGSLLNYVGADQAPSTAAAVLVVVPRPGTISPWSSKATDIFHNCGLNKVRRVERGIVWRLTHEGPALDGETLAALGALLHDPMTQSVVPRVEDAGILFRAGEPGALRRLPLSERGVEALRDANNAMGLALSSEEIDYLVDAFKSRGRNPTDVELMMFAQANSEHCRHKIFNAQWTLDDVLREDSLFDLIRATYSAAPGRVISAYTDNAAVMRGYSASRFCPNSVNRLYEHFHEDVHLVMKVETHNHPTAISPHPGAATGAGGEIRDEAATGIGAKPMAGLTGFAVSNLHLPGLPQPWEEHNGGPAHVAPALEIMLEGPIGAASFNNEFGRPALSGYFRTLEQTDIASGAIRGYHKPIMLAGGMGIIRPGQEFKRPVSEGAHLLVLGGPAMLIGLGGGAASSLGSGDSEADLDFASVQRDNAEMQRRCQEVIDQCWSLGAGNPIISIHDVGAGGLSNALPELVHAAGLGAAIEIRRIPSADPALSPLELWCNEAQERYVLAVAPDRLKVFDGLCRRERAPYAIVGNTEPGGHLQVNDSLLGESPIDMPLKLLLGKPPRMARAAKHLNRATPVLSTHGITLEEAVTRVLQVPAVADKRFLITIGDRTVSGLVVRDQMVGPWQTPVADCAVTASSIEAYVGQAMAVGERPPVALIDAPASGRLALAEAVTNICAARILKLEDLALSANWMAACGHPGEDALLYDTVEAVSDLARRLRLPIPVGKDSLSMSTVWRQEGKEKRVVAPLSVNVTAFAPVADIRRTLTPQLRAEQESILMLVTPDSPRTRLGGSALAQAFKLSGGPAPDLHDAEGLAALFRGIQLLNETDRILAFHDRSDGGVIASICEMAFAGRVGVDIRLNCEADDVLAELFNEEPGVVLQVHACDQEIVTRTLRQAGLPEPCMTVLGRVNDAAQLRVACRGRELYRADLCDLHGLWSSTSFHMQALRDDPQCAREEYEQVQERHDPGLSISLTFDMDAVPPAVAGASRPRVAVLREQGVNGHVEMAAAFYRAGFECVDVHMNDLLDGSTLLEGFRGIAAGGGFSYGDVLGAGGGWAKSILYNGRLLDQFNSFFQRPDTFALGICNGCQMFSHLRDLVPGAAHWPKFIRNRSERFEARLVMVEVIDSPSVLFAGMAGSLMPVAVAHGEGRTLLEPGANVRQVLRFVDNHGKPTQRYPANPNGSAAGLTGFTNDDGRFTILMPHPERVFLRKQMSWAPHDWHWEDSPWMRMFQNARAWIDRTAK